MTRLLTREEDPPQGYLDASVEFTVPNPGGGTFIQKVQFRGDCVGSNATSEPLTMRPAGPK